MLWRTKFESIYKLKGATIQELYGEVLKNEELEKAFSKAVQDKTVEDFLKSRAAARPA